MIKISPLWKLVYYLNRTHHFRCSHLYIHIGRSHRCLDICHLHGSYECLYHIHQYLHVKKHKISRLFNPPIQNCCDILNQLVCEYLCSWLHLLCKLIHMYSGMTRGYCCSWRYGGSYACGPSYRFDTHRCLKYSNSFIKFIALWKSHYKHFESNHGNNLKKNPVLWWSLLNCWFMWRHQNCNIETIDTPIFFLRCVLVVSLIIILQRNFHFSW